MSISGKLTIVLLSEVGCCKWFKHPVIYSHQSITTKLTREFINCIYVLSMLFDDDISKMAAALFRDLRAQFYTADNATSRNVGQGDRFLADTPALAKQTRSRRIPRTIKISTQICTKNGYPVV